MVRSSNTKFVSHSEDELIDESSIGDMRKPSQAGATIALYPTPRKAEVVEEIARPEAANDASATAESAHQEVRKSECAEEKAVSPPKAAAQPGQALLLPPIWVDDELVANCSGCSRAFGVFNRRHHCR